MLIIGPSPPKLHAPFEAERLRLPAPFKTSQLKFTDLNFPLPGLPRFEIALLQATRGVGFWFCCWGRGGRVEWS